MDYDVDFNFIAENVEEFYLSEHHDLQQLIIGTVARLPNNVQSFVYNHCRILSIGQTYVGQMLSLSAVLPFQLNLPGGIKPDFSRQLLKSRTGEDSSQRFPLAVE